MEETKTQEKATVQEAAKALSIGRKTIYRWINKGLLSKVKEAKKTYVLLDEVKAICGKGKTQTDTKIESKKSLDTNIISLERIHYEGLLIRLGQLEVKEKYLLEYKDGLEEKNKELKRLKEENERLKSRSLWQRIFNKL